MFEEKICGSEEEMNLGEFIPDEVRDTIIIVIGMAKLLIAQKLTQFRGLCDKNLVSNLSQPRTSRASCFVKIFTGPMVLLYIHLRIGSSCL